MCEPTKMENLKNYIPIDTNDNKKSRIYGTSDLSDLLKLVSAPENPLPFVIDRQICHRSAYPSQMGGGARANAGGDAGGDAIT